MMAKQVASTLMSKKNKTLMMRMRKMMKKMRMMKWLKRKKENLMTLLKSRAY